MPKSLKQKRLEAFERILPYLISNPDPRRIQEACALHKTLGYIDDHMRHYDLEVSWFYGLVKQAATFHSGGRNFEKLVATVVGYSPNLHKPTLYRVVEGLRIISGFTPSELEKLNIEFSQIYSFYMNHTAMLYAGPGEIDHHPRYIAEKTKDKIL